MYEAEHIANNERKYSETRITIAISQESNFDTPAFYAGIYIAKVHVAPPRV